MQHQPSAAAALEIRALQRGEPVAASSLSAAQVHSIHQQHQAAPAALEIRAIQRGEPSPGSSQAQVHSIHQQHQPGAATDDSTEKAVDVLCLIYMNIVCLVFYLETILSFENKINNIVSNSH